MKIHLSLKVAFWFNSGVKNIIQEIIYNGDRRLFGYLKDFLAFILQKTVENPGVIIAFKIYRIIFFQFHPQSFYLLKKAMGFGVSEQ